MSDFFGGVAQGFGAGANIALARQEAARRDEQMRQEMAMRQQQLDQAAKQNGFQNAADVLGQMDQQIGQLSEAINTMRSRGAETGPAMEQLGALVAKRNDMAGTLNESLGSQRFVPLDPQTAMIAAESGETRGERISEAGAVAGAEAQARAAAQPDAFFLIPGTNFVFNRRTAETTRLEDVPTPLQAQIQMGRLEPGTQLVQDPDTGAIRVEPIPGSGAAREIEAAAAAAEVRETREQTAKSIVLEDVNRALDFVENNFTATGLPGRLTRGIPGTPGFDLDRLVDSIRANVGFQQLQAMREASPTGGALGPVSDRENQLLQSVLGSLDTAQTEEQISFNLKRLANAMAFVVDRSDPPFPDLRFSQVGRQSTDGSLNVENFHPLELESMSDEEVLNIDVQTLNTPELRRAYQERVSSIGRD